MSLCGTDTCAAADGLSSVGKDQPGVQMINIVTTYHPPSQSLSRLVTITAAYSIFPLSPQESFFLLSPRWYIGTPKAVVIGWVLGSVSKSILYPDFLLKLN